MKHVILLMLLISPSFAKELPFSEEKNRVGHLKIEMDRSIDASTHLYVKFALEHFEKEGCNVVLLELDTPGGEVFAAQKISHLLKKSPIPIVAYVNEWAISAGAMLAYSCPFIVTTKSSSMGAAEPVTIQQGQMESAPEKIKSALRSEFINLAGFHDRNPHIAEKMVDKDILLVRRGSEIFKIESNSEMQENDEIISNIGKLLTLNAGQLVEFGLSDYQTENLFKEIPNLTLVPYQDWKVNFFSILSHPFVASLLMMGLMLGFYLEIQMGGFGIPALLGLSCLSLILLSNFAIHVNNHLEIIFLMMGLVLIALEVFLVPSFGVLAGVGLILSLVGLFKLGLPDVGPVEFSWSYEGWNLAAFSFLKGVGWFSGALLLSIFGMFFSSRVLFPRTKLFRKLIPLDEAIVKKAMNLPKIGTTVTTITEIRPQGQAELNGVIFDVISTDGFIDKGEKVKIVDHENERIVVRHKK